MLMRSASSITAARVMPGRTGVSSGGVTSSPFLTANSDEIDPSATLPSSVSHSDSNAPRACATRNAASREK